jgi:hypothetical protein
VHSAPPMHRDAPPNGATVHPKHSEILSEAAAGTAPSTIARKLNVGYSTVGRILEGSAAMILKGLLSQSMKSIAATLAALLGLGSAA